MNVDGLVKLFSNGSDKFQNSGFILIPNFPIEQAPIPLREDNHH